MPQLHMIYIYLTVLHTLLIIFLSLAGVKPFKCDVCDASFTTSGSLSRHAFIHNKSFKCSICNETFRTTLLCKRHAKKEHGVEVKGKDVCAACLFVLNTQYAFYICSYSPPPLYIYLNSFSIKILSFQTIFLVFTIL